MAIKCREFGRENDDLSSSDDQEKQDKLCNLKLDPLTVLFGSIGCGWFLFMLSYFLLFPWYGDSSVPFCVISCCYGLQSFRAKSAHRAFLPTLSSPRPISYLASFFVDPHWSGFTEQEKNFNSLKVFKLLLFNLI